MEGFYSNLENQEPLDSRDELFKTIKGRINKHNCSWCGRPDLVAARLKDFSNPIVGEVTNDPWKEAA